MTAVLGYPTKTAAVLALRAQGMRICDVARMLGISPNAASGLESHVKRVKSLKPDQPPATPTAGDLMPMDVRRALRPHAARRDITVDRLIVDIIAAVAHGDLVDAVLDDAAGAA